MKMKSIAVKPHIDDPPELRNGSGIPMTGIRPIVMPMLMNRCMNIQQATQYP